MESQGQSEAGKEVDPGELLNFCARCFASDDGGSWGCGTIDGHCFNCGAGWTGELKLPRWAIESIRSQASWVGRRYYPGPEDRENHEEIRRLRALPKTFPGRSAERDKEDKYRWWVSQDLPSSTGSKRVTTSVKATSADDAIEASRYSLPYISEEDLAQNGK
jgi:hypothetical protein